MIKNIRCRDMMSETCRRQYCQKNIRCCDCLGKLDLIEMCTWLAELQKKARNFQAKKYLIERMEYIIKNLSQIASELTLSSSLNYLQILSRRKRRSRLSYKAKKDFEIPRKLEIFTSTIASRFIFFIIVNFILAA